MSFKDDCYNYSYVSALITRMRDRLASINEIIAASKSYSNKPTIGERRLGLLLADNNFAVQQDRISINNILPILEQRKEELATSIKSMINSQLEEAERRKFDPTTSSLSNIKLFITFDLTQFNEKVQAKYYELLKTAANIAPTSRSNGKPSLSSKMIKLQNNPNEAARLQKAARAAIINGLLLECTNPKIENYLTYGNCIRNLEKPIVDGTPEYNYIKARKAQLKMLCDPPEPLRCPTPSI